MNAPRASALASSGLTAIAAENLSFDAAGGPGVWIFANPVGRFGTRLHTESTWRLGTLSMSEQSNCPALNTVISAPQLPA
jgi:hypothetical protein